MHSTLNLNDDYKSKPGQSSDWKRTQSSVTWNPSCLRDDRSQQSRTDIIWFCRTRCCWQTLRHITDSGSGRSNPSVVTDGRYGGSGGDKTARGYSHREDSDRVNTNEFLRGLQQLPNTRRTVTSLSAQVDGCYVSCCPGTWRPRLMLFNVPRGETWWEYDPSNTGSHLPSLWGNQSINQQINQSSMNRQVYHTSGCSAVMKTVRWTRYFIAGLLILSNPSSSLCWVWRKS